MLPAKQRETNRSHLMPSELVDRCIGSRIWVIMKGDNEPALQALIERAMQVIRVKVAEDKSGSGLRRLSKEEPAPYDSQSNGATEVRVMLIRGLFRALRLGLEATFGKRVPDDHVIIPSLL